MHHVTNVESDILKYINFNLQYDHVETLTKMRIASSKRNRRIYNYAEYLVHCEPGDYEGILVFKTPEGISAISTVVTVYNRGTARYFVFNSTDPNKRIVMVFLKKIRN